MYRKNESSIRTVMKNKEKIRASFSVAPQTPNVTAIARDKVLMKVEKSLKFLFSMIHPVVLCQYIIIKVRQ